MRQGKLAAMLVLALSLCWAGAGRAETEPPPPALAGAVVGPLAVIAGTPITPESFRAEMERRRGEFNAERKAELLDTMVRDELLFAAARQAGYEKDPEVVAALKQAMVGKFLRDTLDPKLGLLKATDQEAQAFYQAHQADFGSHAALHGALIRIAVSPKASAEKRAELLGRAESARKEALALEPGVPAFGSVAVKYSEDQDTRYRGGDFGWLQPGAVDSSLDKKVSDALLLLKSAGQISEVIAAPDGYYLVKLMEAREASVRPFGEVKDGVRYSVIQEKKRRIEEEFIEALKLGIPVTVNGALLQTVAAPAAAEQGGPPALPVR